MSEIAATTVHEAYAFACMRCGHGWEQAYEISHHVDNHGNPFVVYTADGQRVPSPLSTPTCANCGGHVVRIMRAGRVSSVQRMSRPMETARPGESDVDEAGDRMSVATAVPARDREAHHWQLSDLLRPFQRR
uniref:C2H2-type domain-containing protein n=1 Tax=Streptomyces sp. NBC_01401 TaxID=2903854 RepID=A0AAU3GY46_9ACTN